MDKRFRMLLRDEKGITALETAIILIAFVVVASVFAFTMLSAGMFTTERSKEAVYAGLAQVRGTVELKGGMIGTTAAAKTGVTGTIDSLIFSVAIVAGGSPVDFTDTNGDNVVVIEYRDSVTRTTGLKWTATKTVGDSDTMLEANEVFEISVPVDDCSLGTNETFVIEIKPPSGAVLNLTRTTPPSIDAITELN
jgi:flagellin FlaB